MVSFADSPSKFPLFLPSRFLDPLVLAFGIVKLLHPVRPKLRVQRRNRELCWYFPPETMHLKPFCGTICKCELHYLKHKGPSLYQSIGNYFSHVLRSNLPTPEKRPKVHFALFLKTKLSTKEAYVSSSFAASFHPF